MMNDSRLLPLNKTINASKMTIEDLDYVNSSLDNLEGLRSPNFQIGTETHLGSINEEGNVFSKRMLALSKTSQGFIDG